MLWGIFGIFVGVIIGLSLDYTIPIEMIKYTAVAIIGILDALLGAVKTEITEDKYDPILFITGLLFNVLLALGITWLGEKLGLDLYLAVAVVFIIRIFKNLGLSRRAVVEKLLK